MQKHSAYSLKKRGYRIASEHDSEAAARTFTIFAGNYGAEISDAKVFPLASGKWAMCVPRA